MGGFRERRVWQQAKALAVEIYRMTNGEPFSRDFPLRDQIRRSAISIPSNIAEGDERGTNKDAVRFFYIAKGSLAELETQLEIAHEIGYLDASALHAFNQKCDSIGKMLGSLIKAHTHSQ
jgi:four helix bundle protein